MYAVITAGGRIGGDFMRQAGTAVKALAPFGRGVLIDRAIGAARAIDVRAIAVVGGEEVREHCSTRVDIVVPESADGRENLLRALRVWPEQRLVFLTSDLPFVKAAALREFLTRSGAHRLAMPLAAERDYERRFPGAPQHVAVLGGERVANGSVFHIPAGAATRVEDAAVRFFEARKSVWRMARLLGAGLLLQHVLGRLTIGTLERRARRVLGIETRAVRDCSPNLCYDIDTLDDYRYALQADDDPLG